MVFGTVESNHFFAFLSYLNRRLDRVLAPFFKSNNVDEVLAALPPGLNIIKQQIIRSRWPFFHQLRLSAIECGNAGFPPCSLFKTSFQSLYNVIKSGLDANTQQYISIRPNVKVSFEQKYVIRLILAIVSNSWRAFQLLQLDSNIEELQFSQVRKKLQNSKVKLTKF
jgi:hypothetical protein